MTSSEETAKMSESADVECESAQDNFTGSTELTSTEIINSAVSEHHHAEDVRDENDDEDHSELEDGDDLEDSCPNTGRIPSQHAQPVFLRTPTDLIGKDLAVMSRTPDGGEVLITELQDQIEATQTEALKTDVDPCRETDDSDCDTDLEEDLGEGPPPHDPTGRTTYKRLCEEQNIVPVSYFIRHITNPELCMRYHGLTTLDLQAISTTLRDNVTLEKLNLSGNWIEGEGAMHLAQMLKDNDYITDLTLADNRLGSVGCYHITQMLLINTALRHVDLSGNELGDKDAFCIVQVLEQNKFLESLNLSKNCFGIESGLILGPAIGANDILESLDLSGNQIRKSGAVAIAKGLKENIRIKFINLSWNGLAKEGGAAIADTLAINDVLREVDISGNRLDSSTAILVAKALQNNEALKVLKMGNNPISTKGCVALALVLRDNTTSSLVNLDLTNIPIEGEFSQLMDEARSRRDLRIVHGPLIRSGNDTISGGKTSEPVQAPKSKKSKAKKR